MVQSESIHDLVIRNGLIIDGTGAEPRAGGIAIDGDRITAVGEVGAGRREIDAEGCWITPGFIDPHTHYDGQAIWSTRLDPSSAHGVTTVVMGNCGVGFAPCRASDHAALINVMEGVEDIPGVVMAEGLDWNWETFPQYLGALEARRRDVNVAVYLPHSPLRVYAMGARGAGREPATAQDRAAMRRLAREAVEAGAIGFATSRVNFHRTASGDPIPSFDAARDELREIAAGVADAGGGVVQVVLNPSGNGWADELDIVFDVCRTSGLPATFTFATSNGEDRNWEGALAMITAANAGGMRITGQVFPRPIGMIFGYALSTNPFSLCTSYKAIAELPLEERVACLRQPGVRARILSETPGEGHPLAMLARRWDWMFPMGDKPDYAPRLDSSIGARARSKGVAPEDLAYDLLLEKDGRALIYFAAGNFYKGTLDELGELLRDPAIVIGLGDGGAHYGIICDAGYPTFLLTYWVRDRDGVRFTPAEAIRMLTARPAEMMGFTDRGVLAPGKQADVNVIDPDRLALHPLEIVNDLPTGSRRLNQGASGYRATIVGGQTIAENGIPTGALPGRLIRRGTGSRHPASGTSGASPIEMLAHSAGD